MNEMAEARRKDPSDDLTSQLLNADLEDLFRRRTRIQSYSSNYRQLNPG